MLEWAKLFVELVDVIAWPLVAILIVHWFRVPIAALIKRISKIKHGETEIELSREIQKIDEQIEASPELKRTVESSKESVDTQLDQTTDKTVSRFTSFLSIDSIDDLQFSISDANEYSNAAEIRPETAILMSWIKLERILRVISEQKELKNFERGSIRNLITQLMKLEIIRGDVAGVLFSMNRIRNNVVHGIDKTETTIDEARRYVDIAYGIARELIGIVDKDQLNGG